jgi:hypothetical protein
MHRSLTAAQRVGIQLPLPAAKNAQNALDPVREAVGCNAGLGHPADRLYGVIYALPSIGR